MSRLFRSVALCLVVTAALPLVAQDARTIMDRVVDAYGGADRLRATNGIRGAFSLLAQYPKGNTSTAAEEFAFDVRQGYYKVVFNWGKQAQYCRDNSSFSGGGETEENQSCTHFLFVYPWVTLKGYVQGRAQVALATYGGARPVGISVSGVAPASYTNWTIYVDPDTGEIVRGEYDDAHMKSRVVVTYGDWRRIDGIVEPFEVIQDFLTPPGDGYTKRTTRSFTAVEFEASLAPSLFSEAASFPVAIFPGNAPRASFAPAAPPAGALRIATLAGATVLVDGAERGVVANNGFLEIPGIPAGAHNVTVRHEGYREATQSADVHGGETVPLAVFLTQLPTGPPPLTEIDIIKLLSGQVSPRRVETIVRDRGVSFDMTADVEARLRAAGADDKLIRAIADSKR